MGGLAWRFVVAVRVRPCPLVAAALSGSIDAKGDTGSLHAARMQAKALVCRARLSSVSRGPAKSSPISPMNWVVRASSQNRASSVLPTRPSAIHQGCAPNPRATFDASAKMSCSCSYSAGSTVHEKAPMPASAPSLAVASGEGANPKWQCIS